MGLSRDFWLVWTAAAVSGLGDGLELSAFPLLATHWTRDPVLVSAAAAATEAPWLFLGLLVGGLVDRWDRRKVLLIADSCRALLVAALAAAVACDVGNIWLLLVVLFALGSAQIFFDTSVQAVIPAVAGTGSLVRANSLLHGSATVLVQFAGPAAGAALFAVARWLPAGVDAVSYLLGVALLAGVRGRFRPARTSAPEGTASLRHSVAEGLRWLRDDRVVRVLALATVLLGMGSAAAWGVMVLFARHQWHLGGTGYGLLLTASAVGSVTGSLVAAPLARRLPHRLLLAGSAAGSATAFGLLTVARPAALAAALLAVNGLMVVVWNVVTVSERQARIPDALTGRVTAAYRVLAWGSMPVGGLLGGALASALGLRAALAAGALLLALAALLVATGRAPLGGGARQEA
ncbi:major facilitator superfamily MFS_1 [Streptomyces hygroscopicus subsp. jinggangensis 5008]|nr:major facilitator superfamily MFS_1 [Streptomyces hygroscopicus subsp. jinggangensis 5008]AGF64815.1 major facilitator superfamily MFS_1 [Streptomyces hygroscopicus subsp. jinggangensis TL01]